MSKQTKKKAVELRKKLRSIDSNLLNEINLVLRCNIINSYQIAYNYIKKIISYGKKIQSSKNISEVIEFDTLRYKVTHEMHIIKGFLRFMEAENGVLYAPYSPDNDITDLITPHFVARLPNEKFVIHDVKRKVATLYNGKTWIRCHLESTEIYLSSDEEQTQLLWKKYYDSVTITERLNRKQMLNFMPKRYWKFILEKS